MNSEKVNCKKCNVSFLEVTAKKTGGICLKCKKGIMGDFDTTEKIEITFRFTFAFIFSFVFSIIGFGLGATIWSGVGLLLAFIAVPIGFIYGFFMPEINFFIRSIVSGIINH